VTGFGALALIGAGLVAAWGIWRAARRSVARRIEAEAREQAQRMVEHAEGIRASIADLPDHELDDLVFRRPSDHQ